MIIYNTEIPQHLRRFPANEIVIGGEARLLAFSLIHNLEWPEGYTPRDEDYLLIVPGEEKGILRNEGQAVTPDQVVDRLVVTSFENYFDQIDLFTNAVAVVNGSTLKITDEALKCFVEGEVRMNLTHPKLRSVSYWEYLALRACIQTGYDVVGEKYHHRAGACRLHDSIKNQLDPQSLKDNWYWPTYARKLAQVKTGKH